MKESGSPFYQIFLLVLSIYVLVTLVVESLFVSDPHVREVLQFIDLAICMVFLFDFGYNVYSAENKLTYLKWGWIDLVSSIPAIDPIRWGRVARVIRILRFLRAMKSLRLLYHSITRSKFQSLSIFVVLVAFLAFSISASLILEFERGHQSDIDTAQDALWWSFLNILNAKVSLNQAKSPEGELVTIILNKIGLLIFAYLNGSIIAWLIKRKTDSQDIDHTEGDTF